MKNEFADKSILLIYHDGADRQMLEKILQVLNFLNIDTSSGAAEALKLFQTKHYDLAIGEVDGGTNDVIAFCKGVRRDTSHNPLVPVLALTKSYESDLISSMRDVRITDILRLPYSLDDISAKLKYILSLSTDQISSEVPKSSNNLNDKTVGDWPENNDAKSLTNILLDHYLKHHEIVFTKLKVAQEATHHCIEEVRQTYEKVREKDNTNVMGFKDFDRMWEDVLNLFLKGGLSETDLAEIEKLVSVIPKDIRSRYDMISQQDKSFLTLVESLNVSAYKKAKARVLSLQALPNPLNGRSSTDYEHTDQKRGQHAEAFMFKPKVRGEE